MGRPLEGCGCRWRIRPRWVGQGCPVRRLDDVGVNLPKFALYLIAVSWWPSLVAMIWYLDYLKSRRLHLVAYAIVWAWVITGVWFDANHYPRGPGGYWGLSQQNGISRIMIVESVGGILCMFTTAILRVRYDRRRN
jgi:hypothetical protein